MTYLPETRGPKYLRIANQLRDEIKSGDYRPGDRLPGETSLLTRWRVSLPTLRQAIGVLRSEGLVETRQGIGTFVREPRVLTTGPDRLQLFRTTGDGFKPGERVEVVDAVVTPAPDSVADALGLEPGTRVIQRRRTYFDTEGAVAVSTSWLPGELAQTVPELLSTEPLPQMTFGLVEERTGRRAVRRRDVVAVQPAPESIADTLGVEPETMVLTMTNTYWDQHDSVTEHAVDYLGVDRTLSADYALD
ncbi:MAG: GntR family transcriptional regulator [Micromonosporaceae bacterium]